MIVLLDTDVLIDVALDRQPFARHSASVLDVAEDRQIQAFIAWHSIANFYYLISSTENRQLTMEFLKDLLRFVEIPATSTKDALYAITLTLPDFEDALQIAAARLCSADSIITRNLKHYKNSPIPAQTPESFIGELKK